MTTKREHVKISTVCQGSMLQVVDVQFPEGQSDISVKCRMYQSGMALSHYYRDSLISSVMACRTPKQGW